MGEKPRKTYIHKKQGKNPPFGFPPIPPSIKLEADCFPGRKYQKQAGPTLGQAGILLFIKRRFAFFFISSNFYFQVYMFQLV